MREKGKREKRERKERSRETRGREGKKERRETDILCRGIALGRWHSDAEQEVVNSGINYTFIR